MPSRRVVLLPLALLPWIGTAPAAPPAASPEIISAIRQLDDDSYARREEATQFLWIAGQAAEPALKEAAAHGDAEARARAQRVLEKRRFGLYPTTPTNIVELVDRYHTDDLEVRKSILQALANQNEDGLLVISRIEADESNTTLKETAHRLLAAKAPQAAQVAVLLLGENESDAARRLLETAVDASDDDGVIRSLAAYLLNAGMLGEKIESLEHSAATTPSPKLARQLAYFYRAAGNLDAAQAWATKSDDAMLVQNLLLERRDWPALAKSLAEVGDSPQSVSRAGLVAAVQRFANDTTGFAQTLSRLRALSKRADTQGQAVMAFLLNDQIDDALAIYLDRKAYLNAFDVYCYTARFNEAIALVDRAVKEGHPDALKLQTVAAGTLARLGDKEKARAFLDAVTPQCQKFKDFGLAVYLCVAETSMGRKDLARERALDALAYYKETDNARWLFSKIFPGNEVAADGWWFYVQKRMPGKSRSERLDRVEQILNSKLSGDDAEALAADAMLAIADLNDDVHETWLQLLADTLKAAGRPDAAGKYLDQLTALWVKREEWGHVADKLAEAKDWLRAADAYHRATFRPSDNPDGLWLQGYALIQGGKEKEGRALMQQAKRIPLADERRRSLLADVMAARSLWDDTREQRELILHTGTSRKRYFYESSELLGNDAAGHGDYVKANEYWQTFLLQVLDDGGAFTSETTYLKVTQLVHRSRAQRRLNEGDLAGAMGELRAYLQIGPASTPIAIDFVPQLERTGHRTQADELFNLVVKNLSALCSEFPNSAYYHNELAWVCALTNRVPEMALAHARRAVELAPTETNGLDTLAEIQFRQGHVAEAEALIQKCIELEPNQPRHRKRLEGFKAGKGFTKE